MIEGTFENCEKARNVVEVGMTGDNQMSLVIRKPAFCISKTKMQIGCAVTFVFATQIVQSLYFLNRKFQTSSHLVWL